LSACAPYFELIKENSREASEKLSRIAAGIRKISILLDIDKFLDIYKHNGKDLKFAAENCGLPLEICKKFIGQSLAESYKIYVKALFANAAHAIRKGISLEEVKIKTGLSLHVLSEIEKSPKAAGGKKYESCESLAWVTDYMDPALAGYDEDELSEEELRELF
jgi:hypothetical protein